MIFYIFRKIYLGDKKILNLGLQNLQIKKSRSPAKNLKIYKVICQSQDEVLINQLGAFIGCP